MNHEITLKAEINKTIPALLSRETTDKEALYQELKELCLELGIPYMDSHIDLVYAINGNDEPKHLEGYPRRSESWVRNAYNIFMSMLGSLNLSDASPSWGTGFMNLTDSGGTIRSGATGFVSSNLSVEAVGNYIRANVNVDDFGILVGSDLTAESFEHYGMQVQLTEPNTTHAAMSAPVRSQDGLINKVSYSRTLTNASGGQLTYREVGLFCINFLSGVTNYVMLSRDLISPVLALNNTGYLIPTYVMALTYPS